MAPSPTESAFHNRQLRQWRLQVSPAVSAAAGTWQFRQQQAPGSSSGVGCGSPISLVNLVSPVSPVRTGSPGSPGSTGSTVSPVSPVGYSPAPDSLIPFSGSPQSQPAGKAKEFGRFAIFRPIARIMKFTCARHHHSTCVKHRYMAQVRPSPSHLRLPSRPYASCCTSGAQVNFTK